MTSAIIVAAGSSQRMGFDKLLEYLGPRQVIAQRFAQRKLHARLAIAPTAGAAWGLAHHAAKPAGDIEADAGNL